MVNISEICFYFFLRDVEVEEGMAKEEIMDLVLQRVEGDLPLKEDPSSNLCTALSNTLDKAKILFRPEL